jgi:hypothetical protein
MSRVGALLRVNLCLCKMNESTEIGVSLIQVLRELLSCQRQQREKMDIQKDQRKDKSGSNMKLKSNYSRP